MSTLNAAARAALERAAVTPEEWIRWIGGPEATTWRGDACGCSDDRCLNGYHHDPADECGCLPVLLEERAKSYAAGAAAQRIWDAYQLARRDQDDAAVQAARDAAGQWVATYAGPVTSWSLDELVNGHAGISTTNQWNADRHLIWKAGADRLVRWQSELEPTHSAGR